MSRGPVLIALIAATISAAGADAQDVDRPSGEPSQADPTSASRSDEAQRSEARALFEEAIARLEQDRFAEARDLLRESLVARATMASAYNLALALRGTGEILEALELFERLVAGDFGSLPQARAEAARETLEAIRADVGRIALHACGAPTIEARIDGVRAATLSDCETRTVPVDPGRHVVLFDAERAETVERTVDIERGEREQVDALLVVRPPVVETRSVARSPWLWVAVAAVVGGGVTAAVMLSNRTADLITDDTGGVIFALGSGS